MMARLTSLPLAGLLIALQLITPAKAGPPDRSLSGAVQRGVPFIPKVKIEVVLQEVEVDGIEFGFEAQIAFCADHQPAEGGFVEFTPRDGNTLRLVPVWGAVDWRTGAVVLTFIPVVEREIGPDDLVVAVVQEATEMGCDLWDFIGGSMSGDNRVSPFEAAGTISLSPHGGRCEPVDFGQFPGAGLIETPLQDFKSSEPTGITAFEARLRVFPDNSASGYINLHTRSDSVAYEGVFAAGMPDGQRGILIVVFLLQADREGPLSIDSDLLRAIVRPDTEGDDVLLWSLWPGTSIAAVRAEMLNNKYPENMGHE